MGKSVFLPLVPPDKALCVMVGQRITINRRNYFVDASNVDEINLVLKEIMLHPNLLEDLVRPNDKIKLRRDSATSDKLYPVQFRDVYTAVVEGLLQ